AFGIAASLVFGVYAVRLVVADRALAIAGRQIDLGNAQGAAAAYRVAIRWEPANTGADLDYSRDMTQLANRSTNLASRREAQGQAMEAAIRATYFAEDRQNAWYNLAMLLASRGDTAALERGLRSAIAWAPNWFKPHWTLAQLLYLQGRGNEALSEAALAVELDGGHDSEVAATLRRILQFPAR
ncbi:MAG: hypothetical protein ABI165_15620, partial [Bryobacteraceae bacterium]